MQTNIEKLAEELSVIVAPTLNPLGCGAVKISRRGGKHRIVMDHFIGPHFKFTFDFEMVMPFDPSGGKGKTNDVFAHAKISLSSPYGRPQATKEQVDRYCTLFRRHVYAVLRKEARAGRISSKTLANMQVNPPRKDRLNAAARDMMASDNSDVVDATGATTLEEFINDFVQKDSPEIAKSLRQLNAEAKRKAMRERRKK